MAKIDLIITKLRQRIRSGGFEADRLLPTQVELAKELGVGLGTMKKAMSHLQQEGVVVAVRGKGTILGPQIGKAPNDAKQTALTVRGELGPLQQEEAVTARHQNGTTSRPEVERTAAEPKQTIFGVVEAHSSEDDLSIIPLLRLLEQAATSTPERVVLRIAHESGATRERLIERCRGLDAIIVLGSAKPAFSQTVMALGKPVVFSGELYSSPCPEGAGQVLVDCLAVAQYSCFLLSELNHRKFLLIRPGGTLYFESLGARFSEAALRMGMEIAPEQLVVPMDISGEDVVEKIFAMGKLPTAIVVEGGMRACRVMMALLKRGVRVPEEVSIVALNAVSPELLVCPELTRLELFRPDDGETILSVAEEMMATHMAVRVRTLPLLVRGNTCIAATPSLLSQ